MESSSSVVQLTALLPQHLAANAAVVKQSQPPSSCGLSTRDPDRVYEMGNSISQIYVYV